MRACVGFAMTVVVLRHRRNTLTGGRPCRDALPLPASGPARLGSGSALPDIDTVLAVVFAPGGEARRQA